MLETLNASRYAMMITGSPVATAKMKGKNNPEGLLIDMGISIPKYNTPL